jgi:hypothetical protein
MDTMSSKKHSMQWDLKETEAYVAREITEANVYKSLLFDLMNPLLKDKELIRLVPIPIHFMTVAFELGCVLALAKVFAKDNEPGLGRLVQIARAVPIEIVEAKLSRVVEAVLKDGFENDRADFLTNADIYRQKIAKIRDELRPLRNTQRAHNFPELVKKANTTWNEFQKWLTFAEEVYGQAMSAAGEGSLRAGGFLPVTFEADVQNMLDAISPGAGVARRSG